MPALIAFAALAGCRLAEVPAAPTAEPEQKVFLTSTDGPLVVDLHEGGLRIRIAKFAPDGNTFLVDDNLYEFNVKAVKENTRRHDATQRVAVVAESLRFDGRTVVLPAGAKMRNIWSAVVWKGWVLCLGRTSKTDRNAQEEPPFFATELVAFKTGGPDVTVRYLIPTPPSNTDLAIAILEAKPIGPRSEGPSNKALNATGAGAPAR